jgi:hypothetical protein
MKPLQRMGQHYRFLAKGPLGPMFVFGWRLFNASRIVGGRAWLVGRWLLTSRETNNLTYDITDRNINYTCDALSLALNIKDCELAEHVITATKASSYRNVADPVFRIARRVGWYAIVRAVKPRIVIETGVDKGLGSVVLCAALLRNKDEGYEGFYFGTEIKPEGGYLLSGRYATVGKILYGDSIESLRQFDQQIDVFINDSDHSADYEAAEYQTIKSKLGPRAVLIGDDAHCTDKLWRFAHETGWPFLFISEEPRDHWYRGGGIGLCFSPKFQEAAAFYAT